MTDLDELLDRANLINARVTWGKNFMSKHWVEIRFADGTTSKQEGPSRHAAARNLLIRVLDVMLEPAK